MKLMTLTLEVRDDFELGECYVCPIGQYIQEDDYYRCAIPCTAPGECPLQKVFKIGDQVKVVNVTETDTLLNRYVGEVGIVQGFDCTDNCYIVKFEGASKYLLEPKQLELYKPATATTILEAYECVKNVDEVASRLTEHFKEGR